MDGTITVLAPLITALVEAVKQGIGVPSKLCPFLAMGFGIAAAFLLQATPSVRENIVMGMIAGLAASGLYEAAGRDAKKAVRKILDRNS